MPKQNERLPKTTRFRIKRVNYLNCKYNTSEDDDFGEAYLNTRSRSYGKVSSSFNKEKRLQKRTRSRDELDKEKKEEIHIPALVLKSFSSGKEKSEEKQSRHLQKQKKELLKEFLCTTPNLS